MPMSPHAEHGQTVVEFAIIATVLLMATAGLLDVGRMFFQYNSLAAAARYGARWGSVVGGTCDPRSNPGSPVSSTGWCAQLGGASGTAFWSQQGNYPVFSGTSSSCPTDGSQANSSNSYTASNYASSSSTTIVGAIVQKFDSSNTSSNFITGNTTPGLDPTKLQVCIQLSPEAWKSSTSSWLPVSGDTITVDVYYPFYPVSTLITGSATINLMASATYTVE